MNVKHLRYFMRIQYRWSNLFLRIIFLSSMGKLKDKNQVQQLEPNLHLLTLVFSWVKQKSSFLKVKSYNLFYGFVILTYFFIWTHGTQGLDSFLNEFNKFHHSLSFTYETSKERVNFLDLNVILKNGKISTDIYYKPTDGHQYLHYKSPLPEHIKKFGNVQSSVKVTQLDVSCIHASEMYAVKVVGMVGVKSLKT